MALRNKVGVKGNSQGRNQERGKCSDESDEEYKVSEDEDCDESDGYCSLDSDESEEAEALERVAGSRKTRTISRKETKKARKRRRVSYTGMDDDDEDEDEFMSLGRKGNHIKGHQGKKGASYIEEDDEDDSEFMSSGGNRNQIRKSWQNRTSYTDGDDDDHEIKEDRDEEGEDDSEFILGRKRNQRKKPREKKISSYTKEDDEDDPEVMFSSRKHNLVKKPQEKVSVSCRDDDDVEEEEEEEEEQDDDKDDKEFVLSESDFVDEDTEELKMMKNVKVSRYSVDKRDSQREQKNSRKPKFLKKATRPKRRNSRLNRKVSSNQISRKHSVNRQSKKISSQQKRRAKAESDSDFVSSASSDYEYTISEEEREQMREAKVYCETLRSKMRNSIARTQEKPTCEQKKPTVGKGKEKVEEMKDEVAKQVCGICLSEEGKRTVRGILNCCHHHFCFSCILEWSKVESRCPLCKQRFTTITKAAKSDTVSNSKTVVIPVPERDQIYEPSEEEVRRYLDPYETVICTECHNGGDDAFMLLCDICDSPAHTFCVGHGWEVPEGNWYCNGCTTPRMHTNASHRSSPVAGSFDLNETYVPESTQETCILPEPTVATTLRDRRRIHRQIHHRFLNTIRLSDLIGRPTGTTASTSSAGIRLFGSRLDQGRDSSPQQISTNERPNPPRVVERTEDQVMPLLHEPNRSFPHVNPFLVQVGNSTFMSRDGSMQVEHGSSGMDYDLRYGNAQLQPCTNISSIGSDSIPSPYTCREVMGSSRTPQSGLHTQLHGDQTSKVLVLSPHRPG